MSRIHFSKHVAPHLVAVAVFFAITVFFFSPLFFQNKTLSQADITQFLGGSKSLRDFREATGQEGLWAANMFSGMPAYLVSVQWSDGPVVWAKKLITLFLPHPVNNIFLAFLSYYVLLLSFRVRPYWALAGALSFGLSTYMIIGLAAGHNARIGAVALMPLVMAGIHLAFSGHRLLGLTVTSLGLSLHLRENHLQITYYLLLIVLGYGLMQLIVSWRSRQLPAFARSLGTLLPAAVIAVGTFLGPLWAITEYTRFSIRGPSDLTTVSQQTVSEGLSKAYAFQYSNGVAEPLSLLVPNVYGGSAARSFVEDPESHTYKALVNSGNNELANQLARYASHYWGDTGAAYYGGALVFFLFVVGLAFAPRPYVIWLASFSVLGILLSWGSTFDAFNTFMFDYLPGYNKFRSVTFAMILPLFAMPLLGWLGLEALVQRGWDAAVQRKMIFVAAGTVGVCLVLLLIGPGSYLRSFEGPLPPWFRAALVKDRAALFSGDVWRALWIMILAGGALFLSLRQYLKPAFLPAVLAVVMAADLIVVSKRFFDEGNYQRKREARFEAAAADQTILKDNGNYRVYNLSGTMAEAVTSHFHRSVGGYHGAKLRRYQELYDSALAPQTNQLISGLQQGTPDFEKWGVINMLNIKYIKYGEEANNVIPNQAALGPAWFVQRIQNVNSANEELAALKSLDTRQVAVVDQSRMRVGDVGYDSTARIDLVSFKPNEIVYHATTSVNALAVFSEIYYPKGWKAEIDGKEVPIVRANYVLRALAIPAGNHTVTFRFEPAPYVVGDKITLASSWLLVLLVAGGLVWSGKKAF
ncbi:MAG: YfhO family protein [Cyclobacteriaceae bacterium]|jgi:hypothetical protein|nr:YfhO family protein [Cyclobacteriaceae bacterium]